MAPLDNMKWEIWKRLPDAEKSKLCDLSHLTTQLIGLEGCRVEVVTEYGEKRRFWVGRSTGWRPIHLEILTSRSLGGGGAEKAYKSVRIIRRKGGPS